MSMQTQRQWRTMTPAEWYFDELGFTFHETFDLMDFEPTTQGFITMAEDEAGYAAECCVTLKPLDVALFLIDWWKAKEMQA